MRLKFGDFLPVKFHVSGYLLDIDDPESIQETIYNDDNARVTLPPSSAVAGVHARTDNTLGVWTAPANVSINNVFGKAVNITNDLNDSLNIDPATGKSVNAIRTFAGRGTRVWGARTLAGATPKEAFYVMVGLNQTMSARDILDGYMIIDIGMAAVRPAEFIVLRFAHKMQES